MISNRAVRLASQSCSRQVRPVARRAATRAAHHKAGPYDGKAVAAGHRQVVGRNRQEERSVTVFDAATAFTDTEWSSLVSAVIRVERDVLTRSAKTGLWHRSTETALYLATTAISAVCAASAIRDHWRVENTSHYSRDVTMGEDRSRIRINPGVFARLRSFAFNILKTNRRSSLPQDRFRAAIGGVDYLLNLLRIRQR